MGIKINEYEAPKNMLSYYCGVVLKRLRKDNNLTGVDLAKMLNISQQQVSRYERGETKLTVDMLLSITIALNVSFESMIKSVIAEVKISQMDCPTALKEKIAIADTVYFY